MGVDEIREGGTVAKLKLGDPIARAEILGGAVAGRDAAARGAAIAAAQCLPDRCVRKVGGMQKSGTPLRVCRFFDSRTMLPKRYAFSVLSLIAFACVR